MKALLVESLQISTTLDIDDLDLVDPDLAANLLGAGAIADDLVTFNALAQGPWPVFEACVSRSAAVDAFASDITFTDDLLAKLLGSKCISDPTKKNLLSKFSVFEPVLGSESAVAWIEASSSLDVALTAAQLTTLAQAGARTEQLIESVQSAKPPLTASDLVAVLAHCDGPYSGLATTNGATLIVPYAPNYRTVLQTLMTGGVVKEFQKKRMRDQFEVHMAG